MLIRLWILGITAAVVWCELTGDHICEVEESYPVNVTEYSWRNATLRSYKWCMAVPPRCSFYTVKAVQVPEIIRRYETRIIKKCCPGYAETQKRDGCVACMKCFEGICAINGTCTCNPGFRGDDCSDACEPMRWGQQCKFDCLCQHGSCDPGSGRCDCPSGWFGTRCELSCLEGFFGKHCINRCNCGERELCSPETGECIRKPTYHQEHQSTRAIHYLTENIFNVTHIDKHRSTPSLKKYHTFDMELTSVKPNNVKTTYNFKTNKRKNNEETSNFKYKTLPPSRNTSKIINNSTGMTKAKKMPENKATTAIKEKEDSYESTTEISAEIVHNVDTIPIINEYGSFERKNNTDMNDRIVFGKNFDKIMTGVRPTNRNNELIGISYTPTSNETSEEKFSTDIEKTIFPSPNRKANISPSKKNNKNILWLNKHSINNTQSTVNSRNFDTQSKVTNFSSHSVPHSKTTLPIEKKHNPSHSKEKNSREHIVPNKNSATVVANKMPKKTSILTNNSQENTTSITEMRKSKLAHNKNLTTTTVSSTFVNMNNEYVSKMNTDIPITPRDGYGMVTRNKFIGTSSDRRSELFAYIPPIMKSTPEISKVGKSNRKNNHEIIDEDKLQNLDSSNILTSKETNTPSAIWTATTVAVIVRKNGVLPSTEAIPSTRSFSDDIRNDLSTSEFSNDRTPLKESFDSRRSKEENYLSDEASGEFEYSTTETSNLATHMSIAALISFILIMVMSVIILLHNYTQKRKKREAKLKIERHQIHPGGPTVSVYTHSIFHTPLPDPPTFENPVFSSPTDNAADPRTFQTHVVCSLNLPCHHRPSEKEYTYDHPPSTGSYRAASIPEPPDINEMVSAEPVYDEIPSNRRTLSSTTSPPPSYKSSCIYVNTCGKTRL